MWRDAPIKLNLKEVDGSKCDPQEVLKILQKLEFKTLVRQLPEAMQVQELHEVRNVFEHGGGKTLIIDNPSDLETAF